MFIIKNSIVIFKRYMLLKRIINSFKFTSEVCMRRVVIDTNILYFLTGVSVNEKMVIRVLMILSYP
jgi:hypothetical protein